MRSRTVENAGYGELSRVSQGSCHPGLESVLEVVGKPKRVTRGWLELISLEGWAWWYQDDGSAGRGGITFHTEGFSEQECELIAEFFGERFGLFPGVHPARDYWIIRLKSKAARLWARRIKQFVGPGMEYKFDTSRFGYANRDR
jgi:hypothetical protein